ncbi:uncharacterized protein LOC122612987 [Drosophila teissieri]|uniref:uncharacterized protein LOC122612987 n=1 Tax=Drosophila teissieri TaxID=7243 RepID=UPI001CBA5040|nr:uncharacterized protein LOC122612987 [Drosophila teissieri]
MAPSVIRNETQCSVPWRADVPEVLHPSAFKLPMTSVGEEKVCTTTIRSRVDAGTKLEVVLKIEPSVRIRTPVRALSDTVVSKFRDIMLADDQFHRPATVSMVLGADAYPKVIQSGFLTFDEGMPVAQKTVFGWIVSGACSLPSGHVGAIHTRIGLPGEPIAQNTHFGCILSGRPEGVRDSTQLRCHRVLLHTKALLKRFCKVESVPDRPTATDEDLWCESFFQRTFVHRSDGRYVVRLPFKTYRQPAMVLGRSHQMALNRFLHLERRLSSSPERWSKYVEEIEEYFALEEIAPAVGSGSSSVRNTSTNRHVAFCVPPHHAVFKKDPQSTKQLIVFGASLRTCNGRSLNDILWTGPTLQNDITAVILNWRKYRFDFTPDIQKMYRCIDVHPDDGQYQPILWRAAP